jgi:hypothetical protein
MLLATCALRQAYAGLAEHGKEHRMNLATSAPSAEASSAASESATRLTRALLACGIAAGPLYIIVGLFQMYVRPGFDIRRHALSLLSNGELGWIQIANFEVTGLLVIAGAVGMWRALRGSRGGTWGPLLIGLYGLGLLGAGIFIADPALGFPPGTPEDTTAISTYGLLHFVAGGIGFLGLIAACFVFARRFIALKQPGWAAYSAATGVIFFAAFFGIASGSKGAGVSVAFAVAVVLAWVWISLLAAHVRSALLTEQG